MLKTSEIRMCKKKLKELYSHYFELQNKYDTLSFEEDKDILHELDLNIELLSEKIDSFIENEYAKAVYKEYSKKKPQLIRISTGETVEWNQAFGDDFESINKSLRHSLVGLVEEHARYRFK